MELKKRFSPKYIFIGLYMLAFCAYIVYGLQPVEASATYEITGVVNIPSINLTADVTELQLDGKELHTPDTIVGSFTNSLHTTLLIGHSSGVFKDLEHVRLNEKINYAGQEYVVTKLEYAKKESVNMDKLLEANKKDTLIIMTCAGQPIGDGDATHRFIITASV